MMELLKSTRFVPKLYGVLPNPLDPRKLLIVMEMVGSGVTLRNKLVGNSLNERQKLSIALRLAIGLYSVHLKHVLLNDLKDDNIIVFGSELQAKFIDFGHASCGFEKRYTGDTSRSIHLAPEVREGEPTTPSSDIYSLGYVMALFHLDLLADLVNQCKSPDPGQRPSLPVIVRMLSDLL
ncbi:MAP kinase kinase skh1/pek1-like [Pecten maximus]|uniref:MAP kinase kinase skh1/pek1-like n=1 Tax=Pecten maximus TaxID=6579 RepID=UPI0014580756|nr:MAP kinase kinase skh1/pek1-like [Pecten maximus]